MYTPKSNGLGLPLNIRNHDEYTRKVTEGAQVMKDSTVVVCGMLRDAEDNIPSIISRAEKILALFKDYRILIVENDSTDHTRTLLLEWARVNPRVTVLGCGVNSSECKLNLPKTVGHSVGFNRIKKMSVLRQNYLRYALKHYSSFDYLAVWDMDIIGNLYVDGIQNSLGWMKEKNADGICAYGIYDWGIFTIYYDTYAHIDHTDRFDPDKKYLHDVNKGLSVRYTLGDKPVSVRSCFSGFAIYNMHSLLESGAEYTIPDEKDLKCEHTLFHEHFYSGGREGKMFMNPSMIHHVILNE